MKTIVILLAILCLLVGFYCGFRYGFEQGREIQQLRDSIKSRNLIPANEMKYEATFFSLKR
jgi:hypothetical protein